MTRLQVVLMAVLAGTFTSSQLLVAQDNAALKGLEGMRVRINAAVLAQDRGTMSIQGTVFEVHSDSIYLLQSGGKGVRLPLSRVRTLQVYSGKDRNRGAWLGAFAGAGFGALLAVSTDIECSNGYGVDCRNDGSRPTYAAYVWSYASPMAFVGAIFGAIRGIDRWDPVIQPQRLTIAPLAGGGIKVAVQGSLR